MKVLITGGAGFVGSTLSRYYRSASHQVTAFDNLRRRGSEWNLPAFKEKGITFVHGDIRNPSDLAELRSDFDLFIEASAEPSVLAGSSGSPDYVVDTNLRGTFNCLNFARSHAETFVFLSTSRVYSIEPLRAIRLREEPTRFVIDSNQEQAGISAAGISENFSTASARSFYGTTKLASEYLLQEFVHSYGLKALTYRCSVVAGPGQFGRVDQGVFTLWLAHHYFQRPLQFTGFGGTGKQVRDLLHPLDLGDLILEHLPRAAEHSGKAFNVGGGKDGSISMLELTDLCQRLTGKRVPILSVPNTNPVDVPLFITDDCRLRNEVKWAPQRGLEQIFGEILEWLQTNENLLRGLLL